MSAYTASEARAKLFGLIETVNESRAPVTVTSRRGNAVLIGEADWHSIQETLHLLSIPGMRESIRAGLRTPLKQCRKKLSW